MFCKYDCQTRIIYRLLPQAAASPHRRWSSAVAEEAHDRIRIAVEVHAEALVAVVASRIHQVLVVDDLLEVDLSDGKTFFARRHILADRICRPVR